MLHAITLNWFGFSWSLATWDSIISNVLLAASSLLITITLQFYIPQRNKYGYILGLCSVLAILLLLLSRTLLFFLVREASSYERFFSQSVPIRFAIGFLIIGCMSLISVLWYTIHDQREIEKRKEQKRRIQFFILVWY